MRSLIGQRGYFPNQQNKFSPIRQQGNHVQGSRPSPVQQPNHIPATRQIVQPLSKLTSSNQQQFSKIAKQPNTSAPASSQLWQQQVGIFLKQYGPSLIRQFGPPLAHKVGLPIIRHYGPPLARKVGIPLAKRIGTPLVRKVFLPLAKRAGFALIRRLGIPF
ncbi:MAG: hypothetical protein ACOYIB_06685 [Desulfosporosinus sp.]|jgi:hypothetical protein